MDSIQIARQLQYLITLEKWEGGDDLYVEKPITHYPDLDVVPNFQLPSCLVNILEGEPEPEDPAGGKRNFQIVPYFKNHVDRFGEASIIGNGRVSGTSSGRGILEPDQQIIDLLSNLGRADGFGQYVNYKGVRRVEPLGQVALTAYLVEAWCSGQEFHNASFPTLSASGFDVTLNWWRPPPRFDLNEVKITKKLGSAPSSRTDGDQISVTTTAETYSDTVSGVGTWYYSWWCGYDPGNTGSSTQFSNLMTRSVVVS